MTVLVGLAGGGGILEWLPVGLSTGDSRKDRPAQEGICGATVFSMGLHLHVCQVHQVDPYRAPAAEFELTEGSHHFKGPGES